MLDTFQHACVASFLPRIFGPIEQFCQLERAVALETVYLPNFSLGPHSSSKHSTEAHKHCSMQPSITRPHAGAFGRLTGPLLTLVLLVCCSSVHMHQASAAVIPAAPSCAPLPNEDAARLSSAGVDALAAHHAPRAGSKIMYVQPLGNLEDRLQAVASAATLASRRDVDFVIVWPEHGDEELPAGWKDLYQRPELPLGSFPGGAFNATGAACRVHTIKSYDEYQFVQHAWEHAENGAEILCLSAGVSFVAEPHTEEWFYRLLDPAKEVYYMLNPFLKHHQWARWGQWIGVHLCQSPKCSHGEPLPTRSDAMDLVRRLVALPLDGEALPRVLVVSDSDFEAESMQREVWDMQLTGTPGTAVVFERRSKGDKYLEGVREEVAEIHLLSQTSVVVGSKGSAKSRIGAAAGDAHLIVCSSTRFDGGEDGGVLAGRSIAG